MNRIATRAFVVLILVFALAGGVIFFIGEYLAGAEDWVMFTGSPHVYSDSKFGNGTVCDRDGVLLTDFSGNRTFAEEEAVRLACHWGANEQHARRAAILHDCTKYLELEQQLELCSRYGVELDELERKAVKLLHAKTGACIAKYMFGEPEEVYQAIFWHTTGKADMSLLEKVIYLADYIEPTRDFEDLEKLRRLAYEDIDQALLMGMNMSIEEMEQKGRPIHRNTLAARNWLQAEMK